MRGKFIVFEGLDGCGKTTQAKLLKEALSARGIAAEFTVEPTENETGKLIRRILSGEVKATPHELAALFVADRIGHNTRVGGIEDMLEQGINVICDRYYYSSLAYQALDSEPSWVYSANLSCPYIRRPDLCIFLEAATEVCLDRIHMGREASQLEIFENAESLNSIRQRFYKVFEDLPSDAVLKIDADKEISQLSKIILDAVIEKL